MDFPSISDEHQSSPFTDIHYTQYKPTMSSTKSPKQFPAYLDKRRKAAKHRDTSPILQYDDHNRVESRRKDCIPAELVRDPQKDHDAYGVHSWTDAQSV